jgi:hypothetical protein
LSARERAKNGSPSLPERIIRHRDATQHVLREAGGPLTVAGLLERVPKA